MSEPRTWLVKNEPYADEVRYPDGWYWQDDPLEFPRGPFETQWHMTADMREFSSDRTIQSMHYWTGRGTLCSLDNNVERQPNHTPYKADVTCPYCLQILKLNSPPMELKP